MILIFGMAIPSLDKLNQNMTTTMVVLSATKLMERKVRAPQIFSVRRSKFGHLNVRHDLGQFEELEKGVILVAGQFEYFGTTEWWDPEYRDWSMVSFNVQGHGWLYGFTTITISGTPYLFGKFYLVEIVHQVFAPYNSNRFPIVESFLLMTWLSSVICGRPR